MDKLEQHGTNSNKEKSNNQTVIQLAQRWRRRRRIIIRIKRRRYTLLSKWTRKQMNKQTGCKQGEYASSYLEDLNKIGDRYSTAKKYSRVSVERMCTSFLMLHGCVRGSICRVSEGQEVQEQDKFARLPVSV